MKPRHCSRTIFSKMDESLTIIQIAPGTFQSRRPYEVFTDKIRCMLLDECNKNKLKRSRINMHKSQEDLAQEMIICMHRDTIIKTHCHIEKSESFHVIDGCMAIVLFKDNSMEILDTILLGSKDYKLPVYYRLNCSLYHLVIPISEYVFFHETTVGPYRTNSQPKTSYWSTSEMDIHASNIREQVRQSFKV